MAKEQMKTDNSKQPKGVKVSAAERIAGDMNILRKFYQPYLPAELVAGSIPYIAGVEEESVWNAAVQACGTERVHYTYTIEDGKCWFIATPSTSLASNPDSWCPLAAALPGNSEHWDKETAYLYEQEGQAAALRWDNDSGRMQLFLGASRTILPKVQSMDANFVTINPEAADVYPWTNKELKVDLLSRAVGKILVISGVGVAILATLYILIMFAVANMIQPQLDDTKAETQLATMQLLKNASESLENDTMRHIVRVQELLDNLLQIEGTLVRYEVKENGSTEWEALVPKTFTASDSSALRGARPVSTSLEKDGRVRIRGTQ